MQMRRYNFYTPPPFSYGFPPHFAFPKGHMAGDRGNVLGKCCEYFQGLSIPNAQCSHHPIPVGISIPSHHHDLPNFIFIFLPSETRRCLRVCNLRERRVDLARSVYITVCRCGSGVFESSKEESSQQRATMERERERAEEDKKHENTFLHYCLSLPHQCWKGKES